MAERRPAGRAAIVAQMISVEIESIAAGGDGVGRSKRPRGLRAAHRPGRARAPRGSAGRDRSPAAPLRTIARASDERIEPPCPHYVRDRCGGCQIQHMTYSSQLRAKQRIIRDAIERIGKRKAEVSRSDAKPIGMALPVEADARDAAASDRGVDCRAASLRQSGEDFRVWRIARSRIAAVIATWREILANSRLFPSVQSLRGSVRITA